MINNGVTVLMPVYNAEKYLQEAIESILNQTYKYFEFLIIDDGSTDNSLNIIQSYNDYRIRLVKNNTNLGIVKTLNKGIELASNELIARMDADDISYPERLEKQIEHFEKQPDCAMLATWAMEVDEQKNKLFVEQINPEYYYYNLNFECWIYHPTVMYKRNVVIDLGKYIYKYAEDYDLWWRLSRKYKISILPEVLLDYRTSINSLSRVTKKNEYTQAHMNLLLRNVHFYTGEKYTLEDYEAEFLSSRFDGVVKRDFKDLINCFHKLDYITNCMIKHEGKNEVLIKRSLTYKRIRLIDGLNMFLDKWSLIKILIQLSYWPELWTVLKQYAKRRWHFTF